MCTQTIRHPQHARALTMLLLANVFWGLSFPTIKAVALLHLSLEPGSSSEFVTAMSVAPRYLLGAFVMLIWQARRLAGLTRLESRQGIELGLFTAAGMIFQNDGLQFTKASTSAFLTQMYVILIPIWVGLRSRKNPGGRVWLSCALVLGGVAVLGGFDWKTLSIGRGEAETLISSIFFSGQILCLGRKEFANNDALRITTVMFVTEALVFSLLVGFTVPGWPSLVVLASSKAWLGMTVVLASACTLGAFILMNSWQPKITAVEAGLVYCFEPVFGALFALFLPALYSRAGDIDYANERATWTLLAGGGLITAANVLLNAWPAKKA